MLSRCPVLTDHSPLFVKLTALVRAPFIGDFRTSNKTLTVSLGSALPANVADGTGQPGARVCEPRITEAVTDQKFLIDELSSLK